MSSKNSRSHRSMCVSTHWRQEFRPQKFRYSKKMILRFKRPAARCVPGSGALSVSRNRLFPLSSVVSNCTVGRAISPAAPLQIQKNTKQRFLCRISGAAGVNARPTMQDKRSAGGGETSFSAVCAPRRPVCTGRRGAVCGYGFMASGLMGCSPCRHSRCRWLGSRLSLGMGPSVPRISPRATVFPAATAMFCKPQ